MDFRQKRRNNELKFGSWEELPDGGRRRFLEVQGRGGWKAKYVKEGDREEKTVRFYREIREKYPVDTGHKRVGEEKA